MMIVYLALGKINKAEECLKQAILIEPNSKYSTLPTLTLKFRSLAMGINKGSLAQAKEFLDKVDILQRNVDYYILEDQYYYSIYNYIKAEKIFQKSLEIRKKFICAISVV